MIVVRDKFLPDMVFWALQRHCEQDFTIVTAGDKQFSTLKVPEELNDMLFIDGHEMIFSFIRSAYKGFDNDLRIHADNIIQGEKAELAIVLYINDPENVTPNGTKFWKHEKHGRKLPTDVSAEEFDRLLMEDSNTESRWEEQDYIAAVPNRLLMYDANYFHSKWPDEIETGTRIVLVAFYKQSNNYNLSTF